MLVLVFIAATLLLVTAWLFTQAWTKNERTPPGSFGLPFIGETLYLFKSNPKTFLHERCTRFGDIFTSHLLGSPTIVTTTAEAVKFFLNSEGSKKCKAAPLTSLRNIFGTEQITQVEGDLHLTFRRMFLRAVLPEVLKHHVERIDKLALEILGSWTTENVVSATDECTKFTYNVITGFLSDQLKPFDTETSEVMKDMTTMLEGLFQFPIKIPGSSYVKALEARKRVQKFFDKLILERRSKPEVGSNDLLGALLKDNEDGSKLSTKQIEDNLFAGLSAAQHTTSLALVWMMKYLHDNPETLKEVKDEQRAILQGKTSELELLTWADTRNMPATLRAIHETLRMANVLRKVHREVKEDVEFNGQLFPKGWTLHLYFSSVHYNEDIYPQATKFLPSRFNTPPKAGTFLAFGSGSRMCPGSELAKLELLIFLHRLVTTYSWEPVNPNAGMKHWPLGSIQDGYQIIVKPL